MKSQALLAFLFACMLSTLPLHAQIAVQSAPSPVKQFAFYHNSDPGLSHLNFFEKNAVAMQISPSDMVLESQNTDKEGLTHYKYQQYHLGLPVFGCHYILHEKDGVVSSANGQFQPKTEISAQASLTVAAAESFAQRALKSKKYDREKTKAMLCFFNPTATQDPRSLHLAYMVDFHSIEPFDKRRYFIDANNGKIMKEYPLILQESVPSKAKTFYYGVQDIISDSLGPQHFVLRDLTRGDGIFVNNVISNSYFTNNAPFWDLGTPLGEEIGLDAHFCAEKYYDMMLADYDWSGIDGQGGALIANVHDGAYVNAFWEGTGAFFGDGDCDYGPLTTLEIVGHEFTHGMVEHSSALVYGYESGAINESLADIFGKLLERKIDPAHFSWDLGHSFLLTPVAAPFRVMDDPLSVGMPAYYKGKYWVDGNDVHYNSSIGNLWFNMIVDGKQGINEAGYHFNVVAIGPEKAGQIIFNTNEHYLTENATYNDFCNFSIEVAGNLYGQGSPEQLALTEAWKAVGLPYTIPADYLDLTIFASNPDIYHNVCGLNYYIPISITVANQGSAPYDPASQAKLKFSCEGLPTKVITLDSPIAPGESIEYVVDSWFKASTYGTSAVNVQMEIADDEPNNNSAVVVYNTVQYEYNDLNLIFYTDAPDCVSQTQQAYLFVLNNSCQNIPVGTEINFVAKDNQGNILWSGPTEKIGVEITASNSSDYEYSIPVFNEEFTLELVYAPDPDPENNHSYPIKPVVFQRVTDNYFNDFEINNGMDGYLQIEDPGNPQTILYQNSNFLAQTGFISNLQSVKHCTDPFIVFNNNSLTPGIYKNLKVCVDFSTAANAVLEFDDAMFLNTHSSAENYPYSRMLQIKWSGNESGTQIIYNQPQGQVVHHAIDLPPFFKGNLILNMYAEIGEWQPDIANLNTDDFVLLDNLQLKVATSAGYEAPKEKSVQISPNPAQETTRIKAEMPIKSVQVYSVAGQLLQSVEANGQNQDIDIHGLPNGLYWIRVQLENGRESLQKLVRME